MSVRRVIPRSEWGARPFRDRSINVWRRPTGYIHHTDNNNDIPENANSSVEKQAMRNIQDFHMGPSRGWSDIGYNYVIFPSGRIYEGRGKNVRGAHSPVANDQPGISFYGRFNSVLPTNEALNSLGWLIGELGIIELKGHRDGYSTDCPGDALYKRIQKPISSFGGATDGGSGGGDTGGGGGTSGGSGGSSSTTPSSYAAEFSTGYKANEVARQFPMDSDNPIINVSEEYYNTLNPFFKTTDEFYSNIAYFPGGNYDLANRCLFQYESNGKMKKLGLIIPPANITWSYSLRTKIENTYGGQVIQILGVQIDNFKLKGYVPTGFWGEEWKERWNPNLNRRERYLDNNFIDSPAQTQYYLEPEDGINPNDRRKNGLVHIANFFRDFFAEKTQNNFSVKNMEFYYPHFGWDSKNTSIKLIPVSFPRVRIANDEVLPEWELECSVVEHLSSHFVSQVSSKGLSQLQSNKSLKEGIGFKEFIEWSDPTATTDISISEQARNLGASIANFLTNFNPQESESLAQAGFSYPAEVTDQTIARKKEEIIRDRFGENVTGE